MSDDLISVIIPAYNRDDLITETMDAVWNQTYRPLEMIIVDDGSTDETKKVIDDWMASHQTDTNIEFKYLHQKNSGAPAARNKGAKMARGSFLMFLDSDDLLSAAALGNLIETQRKTQKGVSACDWYFLKQQGKKWVKKQGKPLGDSKTDLLKKWLGGWYIPPCALLWQGTAYESTGGWDESLIANQDGDLMLRYLAAGGEIAFSEGGKSLYRKYADRSSISEKRTLETLQSREKVLDKIYNRISKTGRVNHYKKELAGAYHFLSGQAYFYHFRKYGDNLKKKMQAIDPDYAPENTLHRILERSIGMYYKEQLHRLVNYILPKRTV